MATNLVKFVLATKAQFDAATKDANTIYFLSDTKQIFKGDALYDGGASTVAADLATLSTYIGDLPVDSEYEDLIDYIDKKIAAGDQAVSDVVTTLDNSLADVAKTGAAVDVAVADTAGNFDATNVETVLAEIAGKITATETAGEIAVTKTVGGNDDAFAYRYTFTQGGEPIENGTIDLAKDMVATAGELVNEDGEGNTGTFIRMTIANGTPFYVNVADLIEYNAVADTDEITLTDTNHTITATVGKIAATKIIYRAANDSDPENPVAEVNVKTALDALFNLTGADEENPKTTDEKIDDAITALKTDKVATAGSVITGIHEEDGIIKTIDEVALTAQNVAYGTSTVKAALDTIGTLPADAGEGVDTVVKYVDSKVGTGVGALNADLDAELAATDTDTEAVAVVTGVTETAGVITAVDSAAADAAGAATRAKAAVIGTTGDAATADTIYGAKAYADAAIDALGATVTATTSETETDAEKVAVVTSVTQTEGELTAVGSVDVDKAGAATRAKAAVIGAATDDADANTIYGAKAYADSKLGDTLDDLNADLDASGTAEHAGVFVVSGVTQVDGKITAVDSTEVDPAGAAATAETNAKAYTDAALTWGSLA